MISISEAVSILKNNEILGLPTETVYGLAGRSNSPAAIKKIYALKGRPLNNPLICHVASLEQAERFCLLSVAAKQLIKAFWPGPLTLVVPLKQPNFVCPEARANLPSVGIRCPNHPIALEVLATLDFPIVAPSANLSNLTSPTSAAHVLEHFPELPILDGGVCQMGLESTILDLTQPVPVLLRPGTLLQESIEQALKAPISLTAEHSNTINAPGQLPHHYAPKVPLRINVTTPKLEEIFVGFGAMTCDKNLSPTSNLEEAAKNLFSFLRELEKKERPIAIAPIPQRGIGIAINDRLQRASTQQSV